MIEVTLETRRGKVVVVFDDQENVLDAFAVNKYRWDAKTWARQRSQLIRRARLLCAKIGTIKTVIPHSDKLDGKTVIAQHRTKTEQITAGVYYSFGEDWFGISPSSSIIRFPKVKLRKIDWDIKAVHPA
jgi:hypothetical protein